MRALLLMLAVGAAAGLGAIDDIVHPMLRQVRDTTECKFRLLTYQYSLQLQPDKAPLLDVFDALELQNMCQVTRPAQKTIPWPSYTTPSRGFYVDAVNGKDSNKGTLDSPFQTVERALEATKMPGAPKAVILRKGTYFLKDTIEIDYKDMGMTITNYNGEEVWLSGGTKLSTSWKPYNTKDGANIWVTDISRDEVPDRLLGLMTLEPHMRMMRARYPNPPTGTQEIRPAGKIRDAIKWHAPKKLPPAEQVWVNATEKSGFDSSILWQYNAYASGNCKKVNDPECPCGAWSDVRDGEWFSSSYWCSNRSAGGWSEMDRGNGYYNGPILPTGLTYDPSGELSRFDKYRNATGAIIVAWRAQGWFVNMYEVSTHDKSTHEMKWTKGGFQGGRGWQLNGTNGEIDPTPPFFIENVFEELDAPTEWFFDEATRKLYLFHNATSGTPPPSDLQFVATRLKRLIEVKGTKKQPVQQVVVQGLGLRDTVITYMEPWAPPSGGDWALHRGGAVFLEGTDFATVRGCTFRRVDGNALILSGYNRYATVEGNEFQWIGDTAMAAWGYTDEHDGTNGEQPRYTTIANNICHELGIFQLQSSCWFQAKTAQTNITNNLFFNGPRAGINFNDGFGGGNSVTKNVIFNQCRQSGDHGPINSWDRQLFWTDVRDGPEKPGWNPAFSDISKNVIIANYGGSQGFDNDDGSSWYDIHHNVIYGEGLKQDYGGHDSKYHDNLNLVHHYDGQNCINTWSFKAGKGPCGDWSTGEETCNHAHHFVNNKCLVLYDDVYSPSVGGCPPNTKVMAYLENNQYFTPHGNASVRCGRTTFIGLDQLQSAGVEKGSTASKLPTDDQWLSWAHDTLGME